MSPNRVQTQLTEDEGTVKAIAIYKDVLAGKRKKFPDGFFKGARRLENASKITRYFIEDILKIPPDKIPEKISKRVFTDNKLTGMLSTIFNDSPHLAIGNAYPGRFKKWEFSQQRMWKGEEGLKLAKEATKDMIEKIEKIPSREIPQKVTIGTFRDNKLVGMLSAIFNSSPYLAIENAYPGEFKEWEFSRQGMWKGEEGLELAKEATKDIIEKVEKIPIHEIPQKVSKKMFEDYGLAGMLAHAFNNSPYLAIENAYPGEFKEWEFSRQGMWQGEKGLKLAKEATKDMIEKIEKIPLHEIPQKVSQRTFKDNNLSGMLSVIFNDSPYLAIENAYPGEFKEWEFPRQGMWQGEKGLKLAKEATKDMIEKIEKTPLHEIPQKVSQRTFKDNNLSGMLSAIFNDSPYLAVDNAYSGKFNREDFQSERTKALQYHSKIGKRTQNAFVAYISNYCKDHDLKFKYETKAGSGRIEFWCEGNKVTVIDITRATAKSTIIDKWRKRDYHKDPRIDNVWIVVNSDAFSIREYAEFNRNCPDNMRVFHMLELFDKLGEQPERELRLKLEAYGICRLHKKNYVRLIYQRALDEGKEHITKEDLQTFITDFPD